VSSSIIDTALLATVSDCVRALGATEKTVQIAMAIFTSAVEEVANGLELRITSADVWQAHYRAKIAIATRETLGLHIEEITCSVPQASRLAKPM